MTDVYNSKGWKNRRQLAELNRFENADDTVKNVRRERARMYEVLEEANRLAAEAHAAAIEAEKVGCPCCAGSGSVPVTKAAAILEAWYTYNFHEYKPSKGMIASLAAIARGEPVPPGGQTITATYGMVLPTPGADVARPEPGPVAETTETVKPTRKPKAPEAESVYTADGALIEL